MNLKKINESFKKQYSSVLTESVDESDKAQLKKALVMRTMQEVANGNGHIKALEVAMQDEIEKFFPDKCWWQVTNCKIFDELLAGVKPREICDHIVDMLKDDCCGEDAVEDTASPIEETVSNPDRTISKVDKNLGKEVDKDMVRDLTLIIENDGDVYRRFTTPVIANLKKKKAKGNFDEKLAVQAFVHVVENALRQPYFYRYYSYDIKSVPVAVRYAVAKDLLDGAMDEIEFEDTLTEAPIYDLNTQHDSRKSFYGKAKVDTGDRGDKNKLYSYNTLVAEIVNYEPVVYGIYSATTLRHIKEWLRQLGYKADNAKQIMQDYGQVNESLKESDDSNDEVTLDKKQPDFHSQYMELTNSGYETVWSGEGKIKLKKTGKSSPKRKEFFNESKKSRGVKLLSEDVKVYRETDLTDFEFWSGARDRVKYLTDDELRQICNTLEDIYPDGMTETQVNDIFWFEEDWIAEMLGFESFEEIENRNIEESLTESKLDNISVEYVRAYTDSDGTITIDSDNEYFDNIKDAIKDAEDNDSDVVLKCFWKTSKNGDIDLVDEEVVWRRPTSKNESMFDDMEPDVWDKEDEEFPDSLTAYDTAHIDIADRIRRRGTISGYSNSDHMTPIDSDSSRIVADKKRAERIKRKKELLGV